MRIILNFLGRGLVAMLVVGAAVGGVACKRRPHVDGTVAAETITKAWTADGFDTMPVVNVAAEPWAAGACYQGMMAGLDVLVCEYETDESLAQGAQTINASWEDESVPTAALVRTTQPSRTILAIADHAKADPNGRTMARIIKTFQSQK